MDAPIPRFLPLFSRVLPVVTKHSVCEAERVRQAHSLTH